MKLSEKIINGIDIVEYISKDVDLKTQGKNFVGLCPGHQDTNPSFIVSPEKQICKCFSCGFGGNIISYEMQKNNITYNEAIKNLAPIIGEYYKEYNPVYKVSEHYLNDDILNFYKTAITTRYTEEANKYLEERGYSKEIIDKFNLGFSPPIKKLEEYFNKKIQKNVNYSYDDIINTSIIDVQNSNEYFINRIIIPIQDEWSNIIGFAGRDITNNSKVKYLNTPETEIFKKGEHLFNLNNAKDKAKHEDKIIICEGYFDVISLTQSGNNNVVGTMGANITDEQINKLNSTITKYGEIILCLDNDKAGKDATIKIANKLLNHGYKNLKYMELDNFKDVDELINSTNNFKIEDHKNLYNMFKIDYYKEQYNLENYDQKLQFIDKVQENLNLFSSTENEMVNNKLEEITGISGDILKTQTDQKLIDLEKENKELKEKIKLLEELNKEKDLNTYEKSNNEIKVVGEVINKKSRKSGELTVANFTVRSFLKKDSTTGKDIYTFLPITAFNKQAEEILKLDENEKIKIDGRVENNNYKMQNGKTNYNYTFIMSNYEKIDGIEKKDFEIEATDKKESYLGILNSKKNHNYKEEIKEEDIEL